MLSSYMLLPCQSSFSRTQKSKRTQTYLKCLEKGEM